METTGNKTVTTRYYAGVVVLGVCRFTFSKVVAIRQIRKISSTFPRPDILCSANTVLTKTRQVQI